MPDLIESSISPLHIRNYRPEIDGLRAVAILPVLLFHAGLGFPGGYVGVDIFFVISGYLITSLIVKELDEGAFSLVNFWARRVRRILPAALLLTLAVLAAGWFLLLPGDLQALGKSASAQAVFGSNVYFWLTANYFDADVTGLLPLLHTWSLAVEEQFYVFFPLFLLGCHRSAWLRRRHVLVGVLAAGFLLSLAVSVYAVSTKPTATFYLLPTRAWELLAGSLLAVFPAGWTPARRGLRELLSGVGILTILFAVAHYDSHTLFPGLAAAPPCLGAALIIWSNGRAGSLPLTFLGRLLASPLPVFIGLISYSLYLWHWPLFAFSVYWATGPLSLNHRLALVALAFGLATLSWRLVEGPFRKRQVFASQRAVLAFAACGLVAMFVAGTTLSRARGFPGRFSREVNELAGAQADRSPVPEHGIHDVLSDRLMMLGTGQPADRPQILLWGDSHAAAIAPAIDLYCKRRGIPGRAILHSSTTPLLNYYTRAPYGLNEQAAPYSQAVFEYIQRHKIPRVLLASYWTRDLGADPVKLEQAFIHTLDAFRATDVKLYILLQAPGQPVNVPRELALNALYPSWVTPQPRSVQSHQAQQALLYRIAAKYGSPKCIFVDPAAALIDPDGQHYEIIRDGRPLYSDHSHLSVYCSKNIVEPLIARALDGP